MKENITKSALEKYIKKCIQHNVDYIKHNPAGPDKGYFHCQTIALESLAVEFSLKIYR